MDVEWATTGRFPVSHFLQSDKDNNIPILSLSLSWITWVKFDRVQWLDLILFENIVSEKIKM